MVLVGDPQQLPPTVKSPAAAELGLGVPLLQRLAAMGLEPLLLDTQYRMHPGESGDGVTVTTSSAMVPENGSMGGNTAEAARRAVQARGPFVLQEGA